VGHPSSSAACCEQTVTARSMAELALGIVSLASSFTNAVDSYEYIRLGQHYARDFETNQTKLDLSRLQLSHWGAALGLDAYPTQACGLPALCVSPHEVQQAEVVLRQISNLLDDANAASYQFEAHKKQRGTITALNPDGFTELKERHVSAGLSRLIERVKPRVLDLRQHSIVSLHAG